MQGISLSMYECNTYKSIYWICILFLAYTEMDGSQSKWINMQ